VPSLPAPECFGAASTTIGIRELRNRLSLYLKRVEEGQRIEITNRGEVIAILIPAKGKIDKELLALVEVETYHAIPVLAERFIRCMEEVL
jgi:prevent-host-death family protein